MPHLRRLAKAEVDDALLLVELDVQAVRVEVHGRHVAGAQHAGRVGQVALAELLWTGSRKGMAPGDPEQLGPRRASHWDQAAALAYVRAGLRRVGHELLAEEVAEGRQLGVLVGHGGGAGRWRRRWDDAQERRRPGLDPARAQRRRSSERAG